MLIINVLTNYSYYINGRTAQVADYIDAKNFDIYQDSIQVAKGIIKRSKTPNLPIWLGEGADAYGGGTRNISDRYVSGFL